jgi:hypothetical protein
MLIIARKLTIVGMILCVSVYIIGAVAKLIDPNNIINTINLLFVNLLKLYPSYTIILIFLFVIILWEIIIAFLYYLNIWNNRVLLLLFITNVAFLYISYYLKSINQLATCGCFGSLSYKVNAIHLPYLYLFNFLIIVNYIQNKNRMGESFFINRKEKK